MTYDKTLFTHAVFNTAAAYVHLDAFKDFCHAGVKAKANLWVNRISVTLKEMEASMPPASVELYKQEITLDNLLMLDDLRAKFMSLSDENRNKALNYIEELCQSKKS